MLYVIVYLKCKQNHDLFKQCYVFGTQTEDESETDSEDDEDSGVRRGEPNKFDGLCDGLLNAMALVHCALKEVSCTA